MMNAKNFWLWFGGIWLAVGAILLVGGVSAGIHRYTVNERLEREGRTVQGMVLIKEVRTTSNKSGSNPIYGVTFRFPPVRGEMMRGTADVTAEVWDSLEERGPIEVAYLPDSPQSYRIAGQGHEIVLPLVFGVVGGVIGSIGGVIVLHAVRKSRRETDLSRNGAMAEATVTDVRPAYLTINGVSQIKLRYRFQDGEGKARFGSCTMSPEEAGEWPPGSTGRVRYDPRKPRENIWIGKE